MTNADKGWQLPENVYPSEYWCYQINIPKDISYLRAFRGAVGELAYNWNWQRDQANTASEVVQVWLQQIQEAEANIGDGECAVITCDDIVQCIETSTSLQTIIREISTGQNTGAGRPEYAEEVAFEPVVNCDKDQTYGYTLALWQYIDKLTIDVLERLKDTANVAQQLDVLFSLVPGFRATPASAVLDWIGNLGEYSFDAYTSQKTVALEQEIVCDLFCIAVNNGCTINFGDVYNYFVNKLGGVNVPTATATFLEWVQFMVLGTYPNDRVVYLMSAFQLGVMFLGQEWFGVNTLQQYAVQAQAGNPDSDWSLLCDDCDPPPDTWTQYFDFVNVGSFSQYFSPDPWGNGWVNGLGWQSETVNTVRQLNYLRCNLPTSTQITYYRVDISAEDTVWGNPPAGGANFSASVGEPPVSIGVFPVSNEPVQAQYLFYDGAPIAVADYVKTSNNPVANFSWYITGIEIRGIGNNPFI